LITYYTVVLPVHNEAHNIYLYATTLHSHSLCTLLYITHNLVVHF